MSRLRSQYEALARYNTWMNQRLYALAATLSDEDRKRDQGAFFRSIHGTLNHILLADRVWISRITAEPAGFVFESLSQELYADFAELRAQREKSDADLERIVKTFDGEKLDANISYARAGKTHEHPLWWALTHLFNHQTHHRGQITTLFKQLGHDPGVTDFLAFLRDG